MAITVANFETIYIGLSTDDKGTPAAISAGIRFYETDTGDTYLWTGTAWELYESAITGITRYTETASVTIADEAALSGAVDMRAFAGGLVLLPAAWIAANCGFKVSDALGGTYTLLLDDLGAPVQISTVSTSRAGWYKLPDAVFGAHFLKLWSKSATAATETDVNQTGGPLAITLLLKG